MNYEWRLHFLWPSLLPFVSGLNISAAVTIGSVVCGVAGVITFALAVYIILDNQKDWTP